MAEKLVALSIADHAATVQIVRPDVHNALNGEVAAQLTRIFEELSRNREARMIILSSSGKSFCAGADIAWMKAMAQSSMQENQADAARLAGMFQAIRDCPKPVIARVHGAAVGGGVGLAAVSDIAIALHSAKFAFSEIRLGLVPSVISPFLLEKTGAGPLRRYMLTGESFSAEEAKRIGLISEVVASTEALDQKIGELCGMLRRSSPNAMAVAKTLVREVAGQPEDWHHALITKRIVELRTSPEGQEGLSAFLEKRNPNWSL